MKVSKNTKKNLNSYFHELSNDNYAKAMNSLRNVVNEKISLKIRKALKQGYFKNEQR